MLTAPSVSKRMPVLQPFSNTKKITKMRIAKISDNFTPLHEGILFQIDTESEAPTDIVVEIVEVATEEVIGTKLLRNTVSATVNIAPYVARLEEYAPASLDHTTFAAAPAASYRIRIDNIESEEVVVATNRCKIDSTPFVVTALPASRRIVHGESDELLIIAEKGKTIYAEIVSDMGSSLNIEHLSASGVSTLVVATNDFEDDIRSLDIDLYCDGTKFGSLRYKVTSPLKTATRLAWVSDCGSIERYTFPSSHKAKRYADKQIVATSKGVVSAQCRAKQFISLCSRIEPRATIEALAQIASSPKVWIEESGNWHLVEVVTPQIEYNLFGEPSHLHLDICLWQKEVAL